MAYSVTITSPDGTQNVYACGGSTDQEAMIYAGQVVKIMADGLDPLADVTVSRDGAAIATASTVAEITQTPTV